MITILNSTALQVVDINKLSSDNTLIDSTALQAVDIYHLSSDNTLIECSSLETAPSDDRSGNPTTLDKQRYIIIIT